jgi:transcriptional regulator with XRE-family HTH domain
MANRFKENAKWIREEKGLKQAQIADLFGLPRTTWASYESGKSNPNIELLVKIAKYFDIDVEQLVTQDLRHVQLRNFSKTNDTTKFSSKCIDESTDERTDEKEKEGFFKYRTFESDAPKANEPYMNYEPPPGYVPKLSLDQAMQQLEEAKKEFNEALEQMRQQNNDERANALKAAFEAERRNRELLEEKLKQMEQERSERTQKKNNK